jgi:hypothetical protein
LERSQLEAARVLGGLSGRDGMSARADKSCHYGYVMSVVRVNVLSALTFCRI